MEDKIRQIILKIIYDKLGLKVVEDEFVQNGVPSKKIENPNNEEIVSKYFFLQNDIYLDRLAEEQLKAVEKCLEVSSEESMKNVYSFLDENMLKLLLPETEQKYLFWGGNSFEHMAPADAIVIAFHTIDFTGEDEEVLVQRENLINDKLNYIQDVLSKNAGLKVAVLKYNEAPVNTMRVL